MWRGWKIVSWVAGLVGAAIALAAQVSVDQARTNLGGWLRLVGVDRLPAAFSHQWLDTATSLSGATIALAMVAINVWQVRRTRTMIAVAREIHSKASSLRPSPLGLEVGEAGELFRTRSGAVYNTIRTYNIRLSNHDTSLTIRQCRVRLVSISPSPDYEGPWILADDLTVKAGDHVLIPLVSYGEAGEPDKGTRGDSFIRTEAREAAPTLEIDRKYVLTIRATGTDVPFTELRCHVWIEAGRLRIDAVPGPTPHREPTDRSISIETTRRDVRLSEALAYVFYRQWDRTFFEAVSQPGSDIGSLPGDARPLAHDGTLTIWGKRSSQGVFEKIPASEWARLSIDWFSLLRGAATTDCDRLGNIPIHGPYVDLMASRAEFEQEWPKTA